MLRSFPFRPKHDNRVCLSELVYICTTCTCSWYCSLPKGKHVQPPSQHRTNPHRLMLCGWERQRWHNLKYWNVGFYWISCKCDFGLRDFKPGVQHNYFIQNWKLWFERICVKKQHKQISVMLFVSRFMIQLPEPQSVCWNQPRFNPQSCSERQKKESVEHKGTFYGPNPKEWSLFFSVWGLNNFNRTEIIL